MTKIDQIVEILTGDDQVLLEDAAEEIRQATVADILTDLAEFAAAADATERPGLLAAIQIIKSNYGA